MTYLHFFSRLLSILVYFILLEWAVLYKSLMDPFFAISVVHSVFISGSDQPMEYLI